MGGSLGRCSLIWYNERVQSAPRERQLRVSLGADSAFGAKRGRLRRACPKKLRDFSRCRVSQSALEDPERGEAAAAQGRAEGGRVSIFRQSPRLTLASRTCRYCAAPAEAGSTTCAAHAGEAGRLARDPRRAGYRDPAYHRARRAALGRAAGKCEACGRDLDRRPNGDLICQTHHVDGDPRHNDPSNLQVCCLACHAGARRPS